MPNFDLSDFKKFTEKRKVSVNDPIISINKGGRVSFNKVAFKDYCGSKRFAEFYYKPDDKIIAIKFLDSSTDESYDIKVNIKSKTAAINSYGFFNHNNIDISVARSVKILKYDEINTVIFIKLNEI